MAGPLAGPIATMQNEYAMVRNALADHLSTGRFHDFVINCRDGIQFKVHRIVLGAHSAFFRAAVGSNFAESLNQSMDLLDEDPAIIARLLAFMYTGEYCVKSLTTTPSGIQLNQFLGVENSLVVSNNDWCNKCVLHCHVFALADKYDLPLLRTAAYVRFTQSYHEDDKDEGLSNAGENAKDGQDADNDEDDSEDIVYTDEELQYISVIIREVYGSTPATVRELRRVIILNMQDSVKDLIFNNPAMRAALTEVPDFACDLAIAHQSGPYVLESKCSACGESEWDINVQELCACGKTGCCERPECQQKWTRESICTDCFAVGTQIYPSLPKSDEASPADQQTPGQTAP